MGTLGIINSDKEIFSRINQAFSKGGGQEYELRFLEATDEILEFLNYELPEVVVINFSDPQVDLERIISHILDDTWLLNFGIIGLFNQEYTDEEEILRKMKDLNVLTLLEQNRIRTHLLRSVEIIEENYQIIFQREFTKNLFNEASGSFVIDNDILAVPLFAGIGATILAQRGVISPDNKMLLQLALAELIVNGVEHGNCGISYDEQTRAMEEGLSVVDLVNRACQDPDVAAKKVYVDWEIRKDRSIFIIRDEGEGFDVASHLAKVESQDHLSLHGRGIKMANMLGQSLTYNEAGNEVTMTVAHEEGLPREIPAGLSNQEVYQVQKNDIVFREGESSDFLYYISSGTYSVFHRNKHVGMLTVGDIFMGEMSFLLNKKRSATVRAETPGKLIKLSRKNFVNVIREYPHYGIFLSKLLAKRVVRSNARNASLARKVKGA